ncbi:MAG: hypothetical protein FWE91_12345 [Defluviitaleaceae bacterium]|nr:hypothetical protein [Defluviitaleaceae bacterium]MCL2836540.1 hypothetical protein [Defluviitaleaceae bacterium]
MRIILGILCIIIFTFPRYQVFANGGPGDGASLLVGGSISFIDTPDIYVEYERLNINISPYSTVVSVEYTLVNTGAALELNYIFPVINYVFEEYQDASVRWIAFYDNGKKLTYSLVQEIEEHDDYIKLETNPDYGNALDGQEVWYRKTQNNYYSVNLPFDEGEIKTLTITYKTDNSYTSAGTNKWPLDHYSNAVFMYDFRPASYWGSGKAALFELRVDYTELYFARDIKMNIREFRRDAFGVFTYSQEDFDFADAGVFSIVVDYPFEYTALDEPSAYAIGEIYVSQTLQSDNNRYSVHNLFDRNLGTVWAADNNGIGTVFEIKIKGESYEALTLGILNGFIRTEELYYDNARIKTLKIEELSLGYERVIEFANIPYDQILKELPIASAEIFEIGRNVRLTILDVYPGRKYNDVCISQIYTLGFAGDSNWNRVSPGYIVSETPLFDE